MIPRWYGIGADGRGAAGDRMHLGRAQLHYLAAWNAGDGALHRSGIHGAAALVAVVVLLLVAWGIR